MLYKSMQGGVVFSTDYDPETQKVVERFVDHRLVGLDVVPLTAEDLINAKTAALEAVKSTRRQALASVVPSAGEGEVYDNNVEAADLTIAGQGATQVLPGVTAQAYADGMAAGFGVATLTWSYFVKGKEQWEGVRGKCLEEKYIGAYYRDIPAATTIGQVSAILAQYQADMAAILAATTIAEVEEV